MLHSSIHRCLSALVAFLFLTLTTSAQEAFVELSGTASSGDYAPLWLSANRQGKISPYANSAYERIGFTHDFNTRQDSTNAWSYAVTADLMLSQNSQQTLAVHQLYGEINYMKAHLYLGQRERQIDFRNNRLTSGGLSQGINARPIPEALLDIDYFSMPGTNHWLKLRGRIGFGKTTDGRWQKNWITKEDSVRYTSNILYHEKLFGFKIGKESRFPLVFDFELLMLTQFGGTSYNVHSPLGITDIAHAENLNAFWHAFWPMGSEGETDGVIKNAAGNTVGSYNLALTYHGKDWSARAYLERMFEDQSMLTVQYGIFDHLIGIDVELPKNPYVSHVLVEHLSSKDQAGPVFHDRTENIPESYTGVDEYYNHQLYSGWQNYGMAIGTPLLTSPIYNSNHNLYFYNNRVRALHIGVDGNPCNSLSWRLLATWTRNWGTYIYPLDDIRHQQHYLAEATYSPSSLNGWQATLGIGYDHGHSDIIGNSFGSQLTIRKTFNFARK